MPMPFDFGFVQAIDLETSSVFSEFILPMCKTGFHGKLAAPGDHGTAAGQQERLQLMGKVNQAKGDLPPPYQCHGWAQDGWV